MTRALALLGCAALACHAPAAQAPRAAKIGSCSYRMALSADGLVDVVAECRADGPIAFSSEGELPRYVRGASSERGRFQAPSGRLHYSLDLREMAAQSDDFDGAAQLGASFVAPVSSVLLVPQPLTTDIPVTLHVSAPPELKVAVGLMRGTDPDSYRLMAHEIPVATYFAFGKLQQRELELPGGKLELSQLDGELDRSFDEVATWVSVSAKAVSDFYGSFPVPRASITLMPVPERDEVVFGKVLPESEPGVALLVGQHASQKALYSDWILVHELFHLGFPSFYAEGKWLDEGLATYYEPIIRVRAGLYSELELWDELEKSMPQGVPAFTQLGLERADDFRGIYWGGALACLVADVAARQRRLDVGLERGLRALRSAGGSASEVWSLADVIKTVDGALGAPTLAKVAAEHARRGSPFDLPGLLAELGVSRTASGQLTLSDAAPLAAVRRAIVAKP